MIDGYRFAGIHCGIKADPQRLDLALVVSDRPATAVGVFTQNRVCAAPVKVSRARLPARDIRGIVVNSGNANACTGQAGIEGARRMTAVAAEAIGCRPEQMLVCSTGVIGRALPLQHIEPGIRQAASQLGGGRTDLERAAQAILTTDTRMKLASQQIGGTHVVGFAKGAAMIGPNLATMLGFVLTDAAVAPDDLADILRHAADHSFNCISVEGHTSTNDTVLLLANGSGSPLQGRELDGFREAVTGICTELAQAIAADAEGASHLIRIEVSGLRNDAEARRVAKTIADSALVKTAVFGADPNWGRIVSAAGYAGVVFEEEQLSLWLGDMALYRAGTPLPFDATAASVYLKSNHEVVLKLQFTLGNGRSIFWTCDLGYEYIRLNADYTT